jgi:hypothetical protein
LTNNGSLQVVLATPPLLGAALRNGSQLVLTGTGGIPGAECYLLSSTSLVLPQTEWAVLATNVFDAGGNFIFTNVLTADFPQRFFQLRLP